MIFVRVTRITCFLETAKRLSDIKNFVCILRNMLRVSGSSRFGDILVRVLPNFSIEYFRFLSQIDHIPGTKKSISTSFTEYYYIKCNDSTTCGSLYRMSKDSWLAYEVFCVWRKIFQYLFTWIILLVKLRTPRLE